MQYKNDERYWNIKLLNKWFLIAALLWTLSMIWMFIDDNDDEFKYYQNQYYSILKDKTKSNYSKLYTEVSDIKKELELNLESKKQVLASNKHLTQSIQDSIQKVKDQYVKINIDYKSIIVEVDVSKYLVEKEKSQHKYNDKSEVAQNFKILTKKKNNVKKQKELLEISIDKFNAMLVKLNEEVKLAEDKRNKELKRLDLLDNQLTKLDRDRMTLGNQIADIVRDLPVIDFLDPKLKVKQTVISDVKYDVNFMTVPVVDRCISCHMGIEDSEFSDQNQPYKSHPYLELIGASSSPHPFNEFGCTSCHAGRSRGTSFVSTVHMPNNHEQEQKWEEEYDWEKMHHWLQPMLPSEYSQAGCFKCHTNQPYLDGADKLQLGITLIKQNGCNACHLIENIPKENNVGPDLTQINQKFNKLNGG